MNIFSAIKTVATTLRPSTKKEYQAACLQSIHDEQDEMNRRGHA